MFKDLNEVPPSDYRFPYEYIDAEANTKLDETKVQLEGNEMENDTNIMWDLSIMIPTG